MEHGSTCQLQRLVDDDDPACANHRALVSSSRNHTNLG